MDFQGGLLVEPFATASFGASKGPFIRVDAIVSAEICPTNKFLIKRCQKNHEMTESTPHLAATFPWAREVAHLA